MQIGNITAGYADPKTLGKRAEALEAGQSSGLKPGELPGGQNPAAAAALREILSQYDVTKITPEDFAQMAQKLYKAGAITDADYQELAAVRADLESEGVRSDESVDVVEFYARKLRGLQGRMDDLDPADRQKLAPIMRRLDWAQKLAMMHSEPQGIGMQMVV